MKKCFGLWLVIIGLVDVVITKTASAWTPLVSAGDFTGMNTDMTTIATGIVTLALVLVGIGFIVRAMSH